MKQLFKYVMVSLCVSTLCCGTLVQANSKQENTRQQNSAVTLVKEVEYDSDDKELTFDFNQRVTYKDPKVVISTQDNKKTFTTTVIEQERDELSVRVEGLTNGESYNYTITGVSASKDATTNTLTGTFTAVDRD